MLSDKAIRPLVKKRIMSIDPFFDRFLGPNLYYCHLGQNFLIPKKGNKSFNPLKDDSNELFEKIHSTKPIFLNPGEFILAETFEFLGIDSSHVIRLYNSSSLARFGIFQAALGMINPGCGSKSSVRITLELCNLFPRPIELVPTTINDDGSVNWGTEVLKIGVEKIIPTPERSYEDWKFAAYGKDKIVSVGKMKERFGKEINLIANKSRYETSN